MKKFISNVVAVSMIVTLTLTGCGKISVELTNTEDEVVEEVTEASQVEETPEEEPIEEELEENVEEEANTDITIIYTNDVHSYIDNIVKDADGNVAGDGLRFSKIAAIVNDLRADGENVILVDAGDEIQGDIYGAMDEGETIIKLMKATGYQLATPGNHDFDYGVLHFLKLVETAGFPYVTCNFHSTKTKEIIFSDSYVFDIAGKKVAFVGVSTPSTITSSTPVYFQDENGEFIYTFDGLGDPNDLYTSVQNAIDNVKDEADYVIGLGHLGVGLGETNNGWDSASVIGHVSGLSAFIDGHSHTTMEGDVVKDKDGNDVILTQTGNYLNAVGKMTIAEDGTITTQLINDYDREEESVAKMEQNWIDEINTKMSEKIGELGETLNVNNPDDDNQRLIRAREMNIGDFTSDSVYWFFNERIGIDCDVAIENGGGIRGSIEAGDVTYQSAKSVMPFGNMICLISATGQQILDAIEMGATVVEKWDDVWNSPAENGGFLQVAGLSYTIDSTIPSSVVTDDNGMFVEVSGEYRVKNVKVYNKQKKKYEPLVLDKEYQLGGINYLLRNGGNGLSMFMDNELTVDYVGQDYVILAEYIKSFINVDGEVVINTDNCPLGKYEGYLLDYEDPYGAGRIEIILE